MDQLQIELMNNEILEPCPFEADIDAIRSDIASIRADIQTTAAEMHKDMQDTAAEMHSAMQEIKESVASCIAMLESDQRRYEVAIAYRAPVEHRPKSFFSRFTSR